MTSGEVRWFRTSDEASTAAHLDQVGVTFEEAELERAKAVVAAAQQVVVAGNPDETQDETISVGTDIQVLKNSVSWTDEEGERHTIIIPESGGTIHYGPGGEVVVEGNPGGEPLHEQLSDAADHVHYEADVVDDAADNIDNSDISDAAEDQAEAMHEAADALDAAAEAARETAAEVFTDEAEADETADKVEAAAEAVKLEAAEAAAEVVAEAVADVDGVDSETAEVVAGSVAAEIADDVAPLARHWYKRQRGRHTDG